MCYNIGGNLIAVLTFCGMTSQTHGLSCLLCLFFPVTGLVLILQPLLVSPMLSAFPVISLLTQRLSIEADLSLPLFRNITEYVRGFWMGEIGIMLCNSLHEANFAPRNLIYILMLKILVLKMSHRKGQAGIGYAVQANNLQTSVSLAAVPFSAGLWFPDLILGACG